MCRRQQQHEERRVEISNKEPILEEFIPLRPSCSSSVEMLTVMGLIRSPTGSDPFSSGTSSLIPKDMVRRPISVNAKRIGGAFHPFEREKIPAKAALVAEAPSSSTTENTNGGGGSGGSGEEKADKEKEGHSFQRKARRCWSPELHCRFLHALQQLGGPHVATSKQIKELIKVDALTNDEVKSHLQSMKIALWKWKENSSCLCEGWNSDAFDISTISAQAIEEQHLQSTL